MKAWNKAALTAAVLATAACSPQGNSNGTMEAAGKPSVEESDGKVAAQDGPFGYLMGQSIAGLGLEKMDKPGIYQTATPPKPHDDFETVVVEAYPETGICRIRGIGKDLENDGSGAAVQGKVTELANALATRYGEGHKINGCSGGDIQCESQFWMMTLNGGERYFGYEWTRQNDKMKASNIGGVDVLARAGDINTSFAIVEYNSSKKAACDKARRASTAASL
jgi:hypothetical protein